MSERDGVTESAGSSTGGGPTVIDVTPTPDTEAERPAQSPAKARANPAIIAVLITLVLVLATSPYWAPPLASVLPWGGAQETRPAAADTAAITAKLGALEARIAELASAQQRAAGLDQRLAQLEQRPVPVPDPRAAQQAADQAQALNGLGDRLAALEQRITTLAAAQSSQSAVDATKGLQAQLGALAQKLDAQSQSIAKLQTQSAAGADRADAALVLSLGQLHAALATPRPYRAELQAAEALAKDQPDALKPLQTLDARADSGIPTVEVLRARFESLTAQVDRVSAPPADSSWRGRVVGWVKRFFRVRRVSDAGATGSDDPDQILAGAEAALGSGDLAGAVTTLRGLHGPAAETAKPWLDDAQARLDADQTLAALSAVLTRSILAAPAGAQP